MAQGPTGVTRNTTGRHHWHTGEQENAVLHQNEENTGVYQNAGFQENTGVHQNEANTNAPRNNHDDHRNDPTIKTENAIDATGDEDENEELEEVPMENDDEHKDNESK